MAQKMKLLCAQYINKCDVVLKSKSQELAEGLQLEIIATFENYITNIDNGLTEEFPNPYGSGNIINGDYLKNIKILKCKIEAFQANDCRIIDKEGYKLELKNENINKNENKNDNKNDNKVQIDVMFKSIRNEIKNSNHLGETEIKEILEKIDFIENVNKSNNSKREKWAKLKSTLTWVSTKGVGIAIPVLGIIEAVLKG